MMSRRVLSFAAFSHLFFLFSLTMFSRLRPRISKQANNFIIFRFPVDASQQLSSYVPRRAEGEEKLGYVFFICSAV